MPSTVKWRFYVNAVVNFSADVLCKCTGHTPQLDTFQLCSYTGQFRTVQIRACYTSSLQFLQDSSSWCYAVLISSKSSQFQTIGGISHQRHHQPGSRGRHLKACSLQPQSGLSSLTFCHCKDSRLLSPNQRTPKHALWRNSAKKNPLRIYAGSEDKEQNELTYRWECGRGSSILVL